MKKLKANLVVLAQTIILFFMITAIVLACMIAVDYTNVQILSATKEIARIHR